MFNLTHLCVILHGTFVSKSQIYVFIYNVNFRMMLYCITRAILWKSATSVRNFYSPLSCPKPVWVPLFCWTQKQMFWIMFVVVGHYWLPYYGKKKRIQWKSTETI